MSRNDVESQDSAVGFPGANDRSSSPSSRLSGPTGVSFGQSFIRSVWSKTWQSTYYYVPQDVQHRLCANTKGLFLRLFEIVENPVDTVFIDLQLLVMSIWRGKQLGPDVVYPMLCIRKRQSGRLAKLILEYARARRHHEHYAGTTFPQGIDPPCVATIHIDDEGSHPTARTYRYSTRVDLYGLIFMLILCHTTLALSLTVFIFDMQDVDSFGPSQMPPDLFVALFTFNLLLCIYAVFRGEGTLALVLRSNTPIPGSAVLFDQDFTVVLTGSQVVLEAIAESSFNLSHPDHVFQRDEPFPQDPFVDAVEHVGTEIFRDLVCMFLLTLYLEFRTTSLATPLQIAANLINVSRILVNPPHPTIIFIVKLVLFQFAVTIGSLVHFEHLAAKILLFFYGWWPTVSFCALFLTGYRPRDYPISTAKLLDALGRPSVQKWQFDSLAAAATFQCFVICHHIPRPVDNIDVFAFLDMLVPDQRDVWKAWKARVADRIAHETDVSFAPTIPTFGDQRQVQLGKLLREAQSGYDMYMAFYVQPSDCQ